MTLSRFLKDYLYVPLGGSRHGPARRLANIMIVMLLGGLWHGAGWTFLAWGALHGCFLVINHAWRLWCPMAIAGLFPKVLSRLLTFGAVAFAWTLFRADNMPTALGMMGGLVGANGFVLPTEWSRFPIASGLMALMDINTAAMPHFLGLPALAKIGALLAIVWLAPNTQEIMARFSPTLESQAIRRWQWRPTVLHAAVAAILLGLALQRVVFQPSPNFLYFQF